MKISEFCIKRPVFTIVLSMMITVLGIALFTKLQVRYTPDISIPIIKVSTHYPGADASYMERRITTTLEKELKNIAGLESISSFSSISYSSITLNFDLNIDIDSAVNDIRTLISNLNLPSDMKLPKVQKIDPDSYPSVWISISSNIYDNLELTKIIYDRIKYLIDKLPSVGKSTLHGARNYTMRIIPNQSKLFQYKLSISDIKNAIKKQNIIYPAGTLYTRNSDISVQCDGSLSTEEEFRNIFIKKDGDNLIRIRDIADVKIAPDKDNVIMRYNGSTAISLSIIKNVKANLIDLSSNVKDILNEIDIPGVKIDTAYDAAKQVRASINSVYLTVLESIILVGLVVYLFLGSAKLSLIPLVTIPISLIGTFTLIYLLGFSINIFTLLAMVLAIGLVVDDAIIVVENTFRNVELGKDSMTAAKEAIKQVGFAVISMTLTLAIVFLPVGLIEGFIGKLFIEFAWTLAICVILSGFVALTLSPMMSARMCQKQESKLRILLLFDRFFHSLESGYVRSLKFFLTNKIKFFILCLFSVIILILSITYVNKIFVPKEDQGFFQIFLTAPEGTSKKETLESVKRVEKILGDHKDIEVFLTVIGWGGSNSAICFVPLKDWSNRSKSQREITLELEKQFKYINSVSILIQTPPSIGDFGDDRFSFKILSSAKYDYLEKISEDFTRKMKSSHGFKNVSSNFGGIAKSSIILSVDRYKAYKLGIDIISLASTVRNTLSGRNAGDFMINNDIYDVIIDYDQNDFNKISDLKKINLKTSSGDLIPLESIVTINESITAHNYQHQDAMRSIKISADLDNISTSEAQSFIEKTAKEMLESNSYIQFGGQIKQMEELSINILLSFIFALIFIYLVLAASFESFTDPILILFSVPFSITGGIITLLIFNNTLNMYSNIGLITLIGLITKNSIILVEFANQLRTKTKTIRDAVIESSKIRLRPILMTSIATILGALPLIFSSGASSAARSSIGLVIVGGMMIGTLFTIFVIPILYDSFKKKIK